MLFIRRHTKVFADGEALVEIPIASKTVGLRFYFEHPVDPATPGPAIGVITLEGDQVVASEPGTYWRRFVMHPHDAPLPAEFSKFVATIPYQGQTVHVIEVHIAEQTGKFDHATGEFAIPVGE